MQDLVFSNYGPRWRMYRRLCTSHLFSQKAIDDFRSVRETEVVLLSRALASRAESSGTMDLGKALNVCTANTLSMSMFSRRVFVPEEESGDAAEFKEMVMDLFKFAGEFYLRDYVPALRWFDLDGTVGRMKKLHQRFNRFYDRLIAEHAAAAKEGDLLSVLMKLKEEDDFEGGKLTNKDIKALLFVIKLQLILPTSIYSRYIFFPLTRTCMCWVLAGFVCGRNRHIVHRHRVGHVRNDPQPRHP